MIPAPTLSPYVGLDALWCCGTGEPFASPRAKASYPIAPAVERHNSKYVLARSLTDNTGIRRRPLIGDRARSTRKAVPYGVLRGAE